MDDAQVREAVDTLAAAVATLQNPSTAPAARSEAESWLENFQGHEIAWKICDAILRHRPGGAGRGPQPLEVRFFAAQTLRVKCQRDAEEILRAGSEVATGIRDSMFEALAIAAAGEAPVRTQLALAMAALAAFIPARPPEDPSVTVAISWDGKTFLQWVVDRLANLQNPAAEIIVLEILEVLPQEAKSSKLCTRPERQREFVHELQSEAVSALSFLETSIKKFAQQEQGRSGQALIMAFRAVSSWVRLADDISPGVLIEHGTVQAALQGLAHPNDDVREVSIDVLSDIIRNTELFDMRKQPSDREASFKVVSQLFGPVTSLFPRLRAIASEVRRARSLGEGEEDAVGDADEDAKAIARLFADFSEAFLDIFANASEEGLRMAEIMLEVASFPHYQIGSIGFAFWNRLSTQLAQPSKDVDNDDDGVDRERTRNRFRIQISENEMNRRISVFSPAFGQLVDAIASRVAFPVVYSSWPKEAKQDFKRNRNAVADTIFDSAQVLGTEPTAVRLAAPLDGTVTAIQAGTIPEWRSTEAALFCFRAIGSSFKDPNSMILSQVMQLLPLLTINIVPSQVLYTGSLVVAATSEWLSGATNRVDLMQGLLKWLTDIVLLPITKGNDIKAAKSLAERDYLDAAAAAATALRHVCDTCAKTLAGMGRGILDNGLLNIYKQCLQHQAEETVIENIIEGVCFVLYRGFGEGDLSVASQTLESLLEPICAKLKSDISEAKASPTNRKAILKRVVNSLDQLVVVFHSTCGDVSSNLMAQAMAVIWPQLDSIWGIPGLDSWTIERLCRTIKAIIRNVSSVAPNMGPTLCQIIPPKFKQLEHEAILYLGREIIRSYGKNVAIQDYLGTFIKDLVSSATSLLVATEDFSKRPYMAEDFYYFLSAVCKYISEKLPTVPAIEELLRRAVLSSLVGLQVQAHRFNFFRELFQKSNCNLEKKTVSALEQHREANSAIFDFLVRFLEMSARRGESLLTLVKSVLAFTPRLNGLEQTQCIGWMILQFLIAGALVSLPQGQIDDIVDVLVALAGLVGQTTMAEWGRGILNIVPEPVMTDKEKLHLLERLANAADKEHINRLSTVLLESGDICRRSRKTKETTFAALDLHLSSAHI